MPLKARNPDLYYGNLHIECYYSCQQCEEIELAGAKGHKRVPFAATFLKDRILVRWQHHKNRLERDRAALISGEEFEAFLRKSPRESTSFVNNIWSKIKSDSQYQQEEVHDWASHLAHLSSVLLEFDAQRVSTEDVPG